ncbi:hypothetical protein [Chryseobacterium indoltheticum]|uniref:hypothetical protein n=1 Tax=Chryseobacterium indoltheticum TaxID=254 RepID=UPI003F499567
MNSKEEAQKEKKDSVQKFKLKDTIKLEILSPQQKLTKATDEVKDLVKETFTRFKKKKENGLVFGVYECLYRSFRSTHQLLFSKR